MKDNMDAEDILSGEKLLSPEQCNALKAHCSTMYMNDIDLGITWSPLNNTSSKRPHEVFLAVGNALGEISLWKYNL